MVKNKCKCFKAIDKGVLLCSIVLVEQTWYLSRVPKESTQVLSDCCEVRATIKTHTKLIEVEPLSHHGDVNAFSFNAMYKNLMMFDALIVETFQKRVIYFIFLSKYSKYVRSKPHQILIL